MNAHAQGKAAPFDLQPTLHGSLIELRPLRPDDWDALYAEASDPLVWEQHPASDRYKEEVFRSFFADAIASGGALIAIERATGDVIGSSRYFGLNAEASEIEIGWTFLARRFWGGKYNGEMKQLMLAHAFRFVRRVVFLIGPNNVRSQLAVQKIGATRAGTRMADGRESVVFELTSQTFAQQHALKSAQATNPAS